MIRFLPSIPGLVYAVNNDSLYINLFISNNTLVSVNGEKIEVTQQTEYPWNGKITVSINPEMEKTFTLKLRIPGWAQNKTVPGNLYSYLNDNSGKVTLMINGAEEKIKINNGYTEVSRKWSKGDKVELILPMFVHKVIANEKVKDDSNKVAFEYGPRVYCAEEIDNKNISSIAIPDESHFTITPKKVLSENVISLKANINGDELTLIPYYLWSNRGIGKMKVWFPRIHN